MSMRDGCDKILLLQAEFDGELDAAQSIAITRHRESCACCHDAWERLLETRRVVREQASYHKASGALRARFDAVLPDASGFAARAHDKSRIWSPAALWRPLAGFGLGAAAAAIATMLFLAPVPGTDIADLVIASHVRSMQAGHLLDVASNDQHNVKPWFDGKVDFAPPVKNLADRGFPLVGGRLDYLQDRNVAALVYRSGPHVINVLIWPSGESKNAPPEPLEKGGYNIIRWSERGMAIWAISDLNASELRDFVITWQAHE